MTAAASTGSELSHRKFSLPDREPPVVCRSSSPVLAGKGSLRRFAPLPDCAPACWWDIRDRRLRREASQRRSGTRLHKTLDTTVYGWLPKTKAGRLHVVAQSVSVSRRNCPRSAAVA